MIAFFLLTAFAAEVPDGSKVCTPGGRATGPVSVGLLPGRLGLLRDPCVRTEVGIGVGGSALVDTADFYGRIQIVGALDARVGLSERVEVFARVEGLRIDNVIAPVSVSASGIGATAVGASVVLEQSDDHVISVHGQVVLPTAPYVNAAPLALDLGMSAASAIRNGDVHGGVTVYGQTMLGKGPSAEKAALAGRVGVTQRLSRHGVSAVFDVPLSVGWTGGVDHVGLAAALRFGSGSGGEGAQGSGFVTDLGVFAPLLGNDRTLIGGELRVGYRFN